MGIIVNEILTNTMKYAFPDEQEEKRIFLKTSREVQHVMVLLRDDGRGFPDGRETGDSGGFGMELIKQLAEQLRGAVEFYNDGGAAVKLEFELREKRK